jgi:DNA modification methylase
MRTMKQGQNWTAYNGDCIDALEFQIEPESLDLAVFSPPFADLFVYSNEEQDMGNVLSQDEFNLHYGFLSPRLYRAMKPGAVVCIHIADLYANKGVHGYAGLRDIRSSVVASMLESGFYWSSEIPVVKNPQAVATRLKLHNLQFQTLKKNSRLLWPARNDYLMIFRKDGDHPVPVDSWQRGDISTDDWINLARGTWVETWNNNMPTPADITKTMMQCWDDIDENLVLGSNRGGGISGSHTHLSRGEDDEKHVCPLQLEFIERCVRLWSNPGETVFSPFMGIGSEGVTALKMGRSFVGVELKESYFDIAVRNLAQQEQVESQQVTLFDMMDMAAD